MCVAAAIIGGVGSIAGGVIGAEGAKSAANTQAKASENAAQISANEFNTITGQEAPWRNAGGAAQAQLNKLLGIGGNNNLPGTYGSLLQPFTAQNFQQLSPAYQFQRQQGMQGTLNQDAGGQGALSGAAQKDLMGFNQGLANTAFNNAFNMYQTQQGNIYQRLAGISQLGQAAAANTGQQGTALTGQIGQAVTNVGTAQAGGQVGAANAYSGGIQSAMPWLYASQQGGGFGGDLSPAQMTQVELAGQQYNAEQGIT